MIAHLESFRPNTVDAFAVYVAISRARIYADSRAAFTTALGLRDSKQAGALDEGWQAKPICPPSPACRDF